MPEQEPPQDQTAKPGQPNSNGSPDDAPKNGNRKFIILAVVLLIAIAAGFFYYRSTFTEDTDDAQVDGNLYQVSSRISGHVVKVYVDDNQTVKQGDALVDIDPADYQVALEQAEANLASAQAQYVQATVNVPITSISVKTTITSSNSDVRGSAASVAQAQKQIEVAQARVVQAQANAKKAQDDVDRYTPLVQKDVISKQQFDAAIAARDGANASVLEAQAQVLSADEAVRTAQQRLAQADAPGPAGRPERPFTDQGPGGQRPTPLSPTSSRRKPRSIRPGSTSPTHTSPPPTTGIVNKKNVQIGGNLSPGQDLLTIIRSLTSG